MRDATRLPPESSTTGTGDALDQLEREHRLVEQLFARANLTAGPARLELVPEIVLALSAHAAYEEDIVYPAIAQIVGGGDLLTDRHRREHDEMKELLDRLESATDDGADFVADLRALELVVQAHVAVEEGELFPAYRAAAPARDMEQLTKKTDRARRSPARSR